MKIVARYAAGQKKTVVSVKQNGTIPHLKTAIAETIGTPEEAQKLHVEGKGIGRGRLRSVRSQPRSVEGACGEWGRCGCG